jgi:DNA-binding transcriptional LysR family regulator
MLRRMALEGMGVALLSEYLVEGDIAARRLTPVLADVLLPQTGLNVAYASRRNLAPSVRTFVDFLVESFEFGAHGGAVQKTAA